jgi:hypothetical protein
VISAFLAHKIVDKLDFFERNAKTVTKFRADHQSENISRREFPPAFAALLVSGYSTL